MDILTFVPLIIIIAILFIGIRTCYKVYIRSLKQYVNSVSPYSHEYIGYNSYLPKNSGQQSTYIGTGELPIGEGLTDNSATGNSCLVYNHLNTAIGYTSIAYAMIKITDSSKLKIEDVIGRIVHYKNGNKCKVVGGGENSLLNEYENGNVADFGRIQDIQYISEIKVESNDNN